MTKRSQLLRTLAVAVLIAAAIVALGRRGSAQAGQPSSRNDIPAALQALCLDGGLARTGQDPATGALRFVGTDAGRAIPQPGGALSAASPETYARNYLTSCGSLFGLRDQASQLVMLRRTSRDRGRDYVRFQQVVNGIPVIGGEMIVGLNAGRDVMSVSGEVLPSYQGTLRPTVDMNQAVDAARVAVAKIYGLSPDELVATTPTLSIYGPGLIGPGTGPAELVWRIEVAARDLRPVREFVLINAERGSVALQFSQIETARNRMTYTAGNLSTLPGTLVCTEASDTCAAGDPHAQGAHIYARDTYNFYFNNFGRDSINGAGSMMTSTVHYASGYANAFWNGSQMVYGDAYGFPLADDVVGHELSHGVTQYESNLFYYYQSGAINESLSDVFGEFVDQTNGAGNDTPGVKWQMGEDVSGLGAIRNMQNPPAFGDPDRMTSGFYYTGMGDNGGVHTNSGINNKAAFLMTDGATFNGQTVTGLGVTKVAKIYYEAQANLLVSGADYLDLYYALQQACGNLIGTAGITSGDCQEVLDAVNAVEMYAQPVAGFNPEAPLCPGVSQPVNLFYDNLEAGAGNFSFGALAGTSRWRFDSPYGRYAHSGLHELYADDFPGQVSDSVAAMNSSVLVSNNTYLRFDHAFGFDPPNFDGGVVEYSINGGASWGDAGPLFDSVGYNGTIASGFSNPLSGRTGFVGDSHGYIASRLNLSGLAGQSVRFRWRMGLDAGVYNWGWWLDDVRIYTCVSPSLGEGGDFDGDGKSDVTVFRPSNGTWYVLKSSANFAGASVYSWGLNGDKPVVGDFDGDGKTDPAVFRPSNGTWYILKSSANYGAASVYTWGLNGDIPVAGDFDGDGKTDVTVFRPANGVWYILKSGTNFTAAMSFTWGLNGDKPVGGDFDGDGKSDLALFRPSNGTWYILKSSANYGAASVYTWGLSGDTPVVGDFDGDKKMDVTVFRPASGNWYILKSSANYAAAAVYTWGLNGDIPAPGDFDGDGKSDVTVFRPGNGTWYILKSSANFMAASSYSWGLNGDIPVLKRP